MTDVNNYCNNSTRRRQVARACKKYGLLLQPAAMTELLMKISLQNFDMDALLQSVSLKLSQKGRGPKIITLSLLQDVLEKRQGLDKEGTEANKLTKITAGDQSRRNSSRAPDDLTVTNHQCTKTIPIAPFRTCWRLVSSFDCPKLVVDAMRQQFHYEWNPSKSLMGTSDDLMQMLAQRYELVRQRVVRCRQKDQLKPIMTIDRLLGSYTRDSSGKPNCHPSDFVLLGMLRRSSSIMTGCCFELEDMTGTIPLQICFPDSKVKNPDGVGNNIEIITTTFDLSGIYMDGSMILVNGIYQETGIFLCKKIEFPPLEHTMLTKQYLPSSPFVEEFDSSQSHVPCRGDEFTTTIFCMGHLKLDDPDCLEELQRVISKMKNCHSESILVLFGDFQTDHVKLFSALEEIAKILKAATLSTRQSVLILPGPHDVAPNACWPLPALDRRCIPSMLRDMANVHMCSNPCRLEFHTGYSILLMRKDLIRESLQNQILTVNEDCRSSISKVPSPSLNQRILHHMLTQGHVMPASPSTTLHPVYWNFDHAMRLIPVPDLIIVGLDADQTNQELEFDFVEAGCNVLVLPTREGFKNLLKVTIPPLDSNIKSEARMN
jgi:DNA polymerase epsilon subunit 2